MGTEAAAELTSRSRFPQKVGNRKVIAARQVSAQAKKKPKPERKHILSWQPAWFPAFTLGPHYPVVVLVRCVVGSTGS